jgi:hypothetical protein
MRENELTRRIFIQRTAAVGAVTVGTGYLLAGCGGGTEGGTDGDTAALNCNDTTGLTPEQLATRTSLVYVDASELPDKNCLNCQQFTAGATADACGTCTVVPGTVNPAGNCTAWVAKTT